MLIEDGINGEKVNKGSKVHGRWSKFRNNKDVVLLADPNRTGESTKFTNRNFNETVIIGSRAVGGVMVQHQLDLELLLVKTQQVKV